MQVKQKPNRSSTNGEKAPQKYTPPPSPSSLNGLVHGLGFVPCLGFCARLGSSCATGDWGGGRGPRGVWRFCFSPFVMMTARIIIKESNNLFMNITSNTRRQSSAHVDSSNSILNSRRIVHCKKEPFDVYICRPSKWGNPFSHKHGTLAKYKVASRAEAIEAFRNWITDGEVTVICLLKHLHELAGMTLG